MNVFLSIIDVYTNSIVKISIESLDSLLIHIVKMSVRVYRAAP
jgi:hypothetical protein